VFLALAYANSYARQTINKSFLNIRTLRNS